MLAVVDDLSKSPHPHPLRPVEIIELAPQADQVSALFALHTNIGYSDLRRNGHVVTRGRINT